MNRSLIDAIARLRHGAQTRHRSISVPLTKTVKPLLIYLEAHGLIGHYRHSADGRTATVYFRARHTPLQSLASLKALSIPSRPQFYGHRRLQRHWGSAAHVILSTSRGLAHHRVLLGHRRHLPLGGIGVALVHP